MIRVFGAVFRWLVAWLYFTSIICLIGAVLGIVSHVCLGPLFVSDPDYGYLAAFGFTNGFRYGSVWAGGAAIVLCVIRARKEYLKAHPEEGELG